MDSIRDKKDRLSGLPESVLVHILSFLPTHDAVRTMLVKKSFSTLWTLLSSLDLDDSLFDFCELIDDDDDYIGSITQDLPFFIFVRNVLMRHKRPQIDKFRASITTMLYWDIERRSLGHELEAWITFALRKQVKVLEFLGGMIEPGYDLFKLSHMFVSNSLVELRLEAINMNSLTHVRLSSLRILRLIMVDISNGALGEIILGSPSLKELEIYNCGDLNMLSFAAPNIEKLKVDISLFSFSYGEQDDLILLRINCPNLKSFEFTGFVDTVDFINLSSLVDVNFNLSSRGPVFKQFQKFTTALKILACAERVAFSNEFVTVLFYCMLKEVPQILINWKHVKLGIWLTEKHIHGLNCMLTNLQQLEELVIDVTNGLSDFTKPIEAQLVDDTLNGEDCWRSLKRVSIHNIANCSFAVLISLTDLLLRKASVLNELVFYYNGNDQVTEEACNLTLEQLSEFSQKLPTLSKASQHVKICCIN